MSLKQEDILKIAKLSRIQLKSEQVGYYQEELSKILAWVDMLKEVNTANVQPMTSTTDQVLTLRADQVTDGNIRDQILQNAPNADYGCFIVPKVVE